MLAQHERLWADKMWVGDQCTYVSGDMFRAVPPAEDCIMKRVLYDRNDAECHQILSTMEPIRHNGDKYALWPHMK